MGELQIKARIANKDGIVRVETSGNVLEILINEDIVHPDKESVSLCFKGKDSSGIIDLTPEEILKLYETVKSRIHLIKGLRMLSGSGARFL